MASQFYQGVEGEDLLRLGDALIDYLIIFAVANSYEKLATLGLFECLLIDLNVQTSNAPRIEKMLCPFSS